MDESSEPKPRDCAVKQHPLHLRVMSAGTQTEMLSPTQNDSYFGFNYADEPVVHTHDHSSCGGGVQNQSC